MNSTFQNGILKSLIAAASGLLVPFVWAKAKADDETSRFAGVYSVPVSPELKDFAKYLSRGEFATDSQSGNRTLHIFLPADLIGSETDIDLFYITDLVGGKTYWKNGRNEATCEDSVISIRCEFSFEKLTIDTEKVITQLKSKNIGEFELSRKLLVSAFFGAEPIGIFEYLKSSKY